MFRYCAAQARFDRGGEVKIAPVDAQVVARFRQHRLLLRSRLEDLDCGGAFRRAVVTGWSPVFTASIAEASKYNEAACGPGVGRADGPGQVSNRLTEQVEIGRNGRGGECQFQSFTPAPANS